MGKLGRYLRCTRGNTAVMFALAAVPMLLTAGVSIDMARANRSQAMLQVAADAAALAAAAKIDQGKFGGSSTNAIVASMVESYVMANNAGDAVDAINSIESSFDGKTGKLTVRIKGKINTSLMKLAGVDEMQIDAVAEVLVTQKALEVVLVLDNTGSMAGAKIDALKVAATNLTNSVFENAGPTSEVRMGVVPFSEYVNVGLGGNNGAWLDNTVMPAGAAWEGCVGSLASPQDESASGNSGGDQYTPMGGVNCVAPLLPLTTDKASVLGKISGMKAEGNTYIPAGLLWGWHVLNSDAPITGALTNADLAKINGTKAIVLMTDGANTISPSYPMHDGSDVGLANTLTASLCANAKAANIKVFAVTFELTDPTILDIMEDCANEPGMSFDASNGSALNSAFSDIAAQLAGIHLSQ